jgi:hypothetical protein
MKTADHSLRYFMGSFFEEKSCAQFISVRVNGTLQPELSSIK